MSTVICCRLLLIPCTVSKVNHLDFLQVFAFCILLVGVCVCVQCVVQFLIRVCVLVAEFRGASLHTFLPTHTDVHHHWLIVGDLG